MFFWENAAAALGYQSGEPGGEPGSGDLPLTRRTGARHSS